MIVCSLRYPQLTRTGPDTWEVLSTHEDTKGSDPQAPTLISGHGKVMFSGISHLLGTSCGFEEGEGKRIGVE